MFDRLQAIPIRRVAVALGLTVARNGIRPCPACGNRTRGESDPRAPIGFGDRSWRCWRGECGAGGDAVTLAAVVLVGTQPARGDRDGWRKFREAVIASPLGGGEVIPRAIPSPIEDLERSRRRSRPQLSSLRSMWRDSGPVAEDVEARRWCHLRGLDPAEIDRRRLGRALPRAYRGPSWAVCRSEAWGAGWRLILPAYGPTGHAESLRARWIGAERGARPKEVSAAAGAGSAGGMVYCDRPEILRRGRAGSPAKIVVVEGGPDFLTSAVHTDPPWCTIGIWAGAWSPDIAARIPDGSAVVLWPHPDPAGMEYARKIYRTLSLRRVSVSIRRNDGR